MATSPTREINDAANPSRILPRKCNRTEATGRLTDDNDPVVLDKRHGRHIIDRPCGTFCNRQARAAKIRVLAIAHVIEERPTRLAIPSAEVPRLHDRVEQTTALQPQTLKEDKIAVRGRSASRRVSSTPWGRAPGQAVGIPLLALVPRGPEREQARAAVGIPAPLCSVGPVLGSLVRRAPLPPEGIRSAHPVGPTPRTMISALQHSKRSAQWPKEAPCLIGWSQRRSA